MEQVKANELRLGSLILHNGEIVSVYSIEHRYKTVFRINDIDVDERIIGDKYQPIPLTPELLEACGFEHKGGWMGKKFVTQIFHTETEIVFEVMGKVLVIYANDVRLRMIDQPALHQVTNCWYEFTGTELSINLEKVKV